MKKSLLALAVLGAFAGAASAQTNVTIYGVVDAGINYDNGGAAAGKTWKLSSGQQNGSRLGFKGTEDLGGGLAVSFVLENGFNSDDGTLGQGGRLFGRQAWVGLNGDFGSVKLGRQQTALYYATLAVDPFGINQAGNLQKAFGYGLYNVDPLSRADNTISYTSPNFSGFTASVAYSFGEVAGDTSANRDIGLGLSYANGPLNVQFAYNKVNASGITLTGNLLADANRVLGLPATSPSPALDVKTSFLGGTYDFGVAKLHLAFADTKGDVAAGSVKDRNYMIGGSAPVGAAGKVLASWIRNDFRDFSASKSDQYAIGYTHTLSKRTSIYSSVGYTKNDANVRLNAATLGDSDRTFQVGVTHWF
jgi:predicted porin